ncbi:unnamed protein product [Prunus armeniaca]|uniref:Uncharacterized protein n=1 Tax=Prunus armeniaca TaxID=36596 RepID=A0A6J5UZH0_PRUAR|nr:unnamed protein product [Prunus armeniaca]
MAIETKRKILIGEDDEGEAQGTKETPTTEESLMTKKSRKEIRDRRLHGLSRRWIGLEEKARCGLESNSSPPNRPMTIRSEFATNLPITKLAPENSAKKCSHWPENSDADAMSVCMRDVPYRRNSRSDWGRSAIELQRRVSGGGSGKLTSPSSQAQLPAPFPHWLNSKTTEIYVCFHSSVSGLLEYFKTVQYRLAKSAAMFNCIFRQMAQGMQSHLGFYCHPFGSGCPIDFLCNSLMMLPNSASPMEAASIAC